MVNRVRELLAEGKDVVNGWIQIPSAFGAEAMARAGWDGMTFDMQHGILDYMTTVLGIQATHHYAAVPTVRVPWNEPGIIGKVLDAGAMGIICPMINTGEQARKLVDAMRYPPLGSRSHGPVRAGTYGEPGTYYKTANSDVLCFAMIETPEAVENLDEILDVEGLDGIYIGPGDLGLAMGLAPKLDREEPEILAIYEKIVTKVRAKGLVAGIHNATAEYSLRMSAMGFQFNTIFTDTGLLLDAAKSQVQRFRAGTDGK